MDPMVIIWIGIAFFVFVIVLPSIKVVPQRSAYIVERLGKYKGTLQAGFTILVPFLDKVRYKHSLKEQAIDVASQTCITRDNIAVEVDGILYLQVIDPAKASYGIEDYKFASSNNALIIPSNLADISSIISSATAVFQSVSKKTDRK